MDYEWDGKKNDANIVKHGFTMAQGIAVWGDDKRTEYPDNRKDYRECRFITVGKHDGTILSVCWTKRKNGIRIISVRLASRKERRLYNGNS